MTGDAREEVTRLLAENRRLRELLTEHGIAYRQGVFLKGDGGDHRSLATSPDSVEPVVNRVGHLIQPPVPRSCIRQRHA